MSQYVFQGWEFKEPEQSPEDTTAAIGAWDVGSKGARTRLDSIVCQTHRSSHADRITSIGTTPPADRSSVTPPRPISVIYSPVLGDGSTS